MSDFVDGGKFDIVWDGLMEEVVMSEEDFANQFGINPSVFNEPFDESTNANVNLNKSHLESLTETKSKTENSENISDATEITTEDVKKFIEAEDNKNTIRKTLADVSRFQQYLAKKGETKAIHNLSVDHLDEYLATYLLSIRKSDGDEYEPVTLRSIVGSIERKLQRAKYPYSIFRSSGPEFSLTRDCLKAKQKNLKKQGKGKFNHCFYNKYGMKFVNKTALLT
jgi:translation elongation factor EF-G